MRPALVKGLFPFPFPAVIGQYSAMGKFSLERLDLHLKRIGLSDAQASKKAGLGDSYIRDLRRKGVSPSAENVTKLANAIGTTFADLMGEDSPAPVEPPDFFSEDEIRKAIIGAMRSSRGKSAWTPEMLADLVIALLNVRALEESSSNSKPDISLTG